MTEFDENKIWSSRDIVNNASNWSLAADKELLRHLQSLSEKILSNAAKTNDSLVGLLDDLENTKLSLDLSNIELESLHHTQFIESRVYEDDDEFETEESKDVPVAVDKKSEEEKTRLEIEEGILAAVKAVEEYYDYKEVPNSDSDDENDSPNFVWQPKDPYLTRPLPYVIGTTEWYRKWHVGLLDDSSDEEDVNPDVKSSRTVADDVDSSEGSDDERYLPQLDRRSTMKIDNDDNINNQWRPSDKINIDKKNGMNPIANSTLVPDVAQYGESSNEGSSLPIKEPSAACFAEQLVQKLGNVAQAQELSREINTRPIQKPPTITKVNMFFDEPPPINDDSDSSDNGDIFGKPKISEGLFARSQAGLFDDSDEEDSTLHGQIKDVPKKVQPKNASSDESEVDIFAPKPADRAATSKYLQKSSKTLPLFNDGPPELPQEKKKKPIGGVSIFGNTDIMKPGFVIKNLRNDSRESTPELDVTSSINKTQEVDTVKTTNNNVPDVKKTEETPNTLVENKKERLEISLSKEKPKQNLSLFDGNDSFLEDDLFSNNSSKKFTSSLFDDDDDDDDSLERNDSSALFYTSNVSTVKKNDLLNNKTDNTKDLIHKESTEQKASLFEQSTKISSQDNSSNQKNVNSDIFKTSELVEREIFSPEPAKSLFDEPTDNSNRTVRPQKRHNLFDNEIVKSDNDDKSENVNKTSLSLFKKKSSKHQETVENDILSLFNDETVQFGKENKPNVNKPEPSKRASLFNDLAPNLQENVQNKRLGFFNDEGVKSNTSNSSTVKHSEPRLFHDLFDDRTVKSDTENKSTANSTEPINRVSLFNDTAPKLQENFQNKSLFDDETVKSDTENITNKSETTTRPSLFRNFSAKSQENVENKRQDFVHKTKCDTVKSDYDNLADVTKPEPSKRISLLDDLSSKNKEKVKEKLSKPVNLSEKHEYLAYDSTSDTTLAIAQNAQDLVYKATSTKPNLFDDFDEPSTLFNDVDENNLFNNEEDIKIDGNTSEVNDTTVRNEDKGRIPLKDENVQITSIPTNKNVDSVDDTSRRLPETVVQSVLEPEISVNTKTANEYPPYKSTQLSLHDTPPIFEDDADSDSEPNLFNDDNRLSFEDDDIDLSPPVSRGFFDDEPPLLLIEKTEIQRSKTPPEATPTDESDNHEPVLYSRISMQNNFSASPSTRTNLSIHERLNSIRAPSFDKDMKDTKENAEDNVVLECEEVRNDVLNQPIIINNLDKSPRKLGVPGKIKHNININVGALLPGVSRKADKPEVENTETATRSSLDELDNNTDILHCMTKDRAKILVKRRPSTRKARRDISSKIFDDLVVTENVENVADTEIKQIAAIRENESSTSCQNSDQKTPPVETAPQKSIQDEAKQISTGAIKKIITTKKQPSLFASPDSSDSDDIFKTKPLGSKTNKNKPPITKNSTEPSDIFNGVKIQSLFDKQPVIKGDVFESPDYKKSKIFFDDDDENVDDFFSSKKLPPKSNIMKKNLFDDEEEGDDLFQSTLFKSDDIKPAKITARVKKSSKSSLFPVADATDDPLELFK